MPVAEIEGGLGSQMLTYAAARRLALKVGGEVLIDTRNYRNYKKFKPELHHFDVDAILLDDLQADALCGPQNQLIDVVQPRHIHVDTAILDLDRPNVLMRGNYPSEDYFADVADTIRKDFTRVTEPNAYGKTMSEELSTLSDRGYEPIAVHVRRGDYVNEAHTNAFHGVPTIEYYENAFGWIQRMVDNPWFMFFSNDPEWVEGAFSLDNMTVAHPTEDTEPVEDMMLMAQCRHHIIANSSYSWWGAWLGEHPEQIVIAPRHFMAERSMNTNDLCKRNWITLGSNPRPGGGI